MTTASLAIDSKVVDTRDRGSGRGAADSKATSPRQAFDGILSGLTDDASAAVAASGTATATLAAGPTVLAPQIATLDVKADTTTVPSGDIDPGAAITALVGKIIGQDGTPAPTKSSKASSSKDASAAAAEGTSGTTAQGLLPADLAALLVAPTQAARVDQGGASSPSKAGTSIDRPPAAIDSGLHSAPSTTAEPANKDAAPAITGISVETKLAPWTDTSAAVAAVAAKAEPDSSAADSSMMTGIIRTIADGVIDLASAEAPTPQPVALSSTGTAPLSPAQTLTLQLTPADLGTVSVRLHLTGDSLDIQLSISDPQTLGLLDRDRDMLSSAIGSQSYQVHSLVIQGMDASASASGGHNASQNDKNGATQGDANRGDDRAPRDGSRQDQQPQSRPRDRTGTGASSGAAGQLFV